MVVGVGSQCNVLKYEEPVNNNSTKNNNKIT